MGWAVYSDAATWLSPGPPALNTIKVNDVDGDFHLFKRKGKDTWTNAMMFYQVWKDIRDTGKTAGSDWVIKTDIDAVFLPERLLHRLQGFHVPEGGVFLENCQEVDVHPDCEGNQAIVIHPLKKSDEYFTCLAVTQGLDPRR